MNELMKKEKTAIERFKAFEPPDGYYLAYSGGKDSDCIKILAQLADVKFEAVHNLTTVDAPETVRYIKSQSDVRIEKAYYKDGTHKTMWNLIVKKAFPPTRIARYCCGDLKESGGVGRLVVTGVRWAESTRRKANCDLIQILGKPKSSQMLAEELGADYNITRKGGIIMNDDNDANRRMVEMCYRTRKSILNPIIEWSDNDVWEFLRYYKCESNPLYQCGFQRIGCIGCPLAGKHMRKTEFERYPKYKDAYIRTFDRMLQSRRKRGLVMFDMAQTGEELFNWWVNG